MSPYDGSNYECSYIDTKAVDLEYGSSYESTPFVRLDPSRFDNIETKAVESEIRIKLRIHSIRTNRVDSTVLDMYGKSNTFVSKCFAALVIDLLV